MRGRVFGGEVHERAGPWELSSGVLSERPNKHCYHVVRRIVLQCSRSGSTVSRQFAQPMETDQAAPKEIC
jgi:hypothetical protein